MIRKKYRKLKLIIVILMCAFIFFGIPTIILGNKISKKNATIIFDKYLQQQIDENKKIYNVVDLVRYMKNENLSNNYDITTDDNNLVTFDNKINIKIVIDNFSESNIYYCNINNNDIQTRLNIEEREQSINIELVEGANEIQVELYENSEKIKSIKDVIYYVKPYEKQFLDELSKNGIAVHYGKSEEYNKSGELLKSLGVQYIRTDFFKYVINPSGEDYNYDAYDEWMNDLEKSGIKVIAIADGAYNVNSESDLENYINFFYNIGEKYPQIEYFEIINEPNYRYITETDVEWYTKIVNTLEQNSKFKILNGGLALTENSTGNFLDAYEFYNKFNLNGGWKYNDTINFHIYTSSKINETINNFRKISKNYGGFNKIYITEYGDSSGETSEQSQARRSC
ncbi:hypothetical protein [uncultured Clostridium sp.]|uniref:hypothetical protein n=1 Tax=uncultured Clostridium sp. TaxID=59620 RepID=UPI0025947182|nr:hypothetical protein [uncultured Clostridium sp.]